MIPRTIATWQSKSWQEELSELIRSPESLFEHLKLPLEHLEAAKRAHKLFPIRATQAYLSRAVRGDIHDPLVRQVLPLAEEENAHHGFVEDPLAEAAQSPVPGLIHKYKGRVLLIAASQCAINCRYCFRRHFDYQGHQKDQQHWQEALTYIADDESIHEVILSGGDPLVISDKKIAALIANIENIPHVKRLRIHSRLPIVAPSRITDTLLALLSGSRLKCVFVVHCNHAQEIDLEVKHALHSIRAAGITLLNQSVLLHGVNDDAKALIELSEALFEAGALPYYLHLVDKVAGAAHFYIDESKARSLHNALLGTLPGYLVPKLVKELPNSPSKTPIV